MFVLEQDLSTEKCQDSDKIRVCLRHCMNVNQAMRVRRDSVLWRYILSTYP